MARICQLSHVELTYNFLAPLFRALRDQGHEVVAACNLDADGRYLEQYLGKDFTVHRIRGARALRWRTFTTEVRDLARYLKREQFDILHVHSPLVAMQARLAARLAGVPVVIYHVHGFAFHEGMRPVTYRLAYHTERLFARRLTDYLVTVNEEDWRLARRDRFRPEPDAIVFAPGVGIDTDRFRPPRPEEGADRAACRRELGIPQDGIGLAFVGRLVAEKGIRELVEAFQTVAEANPDVWLVIVGGTLDSERDHSMKPFLEQAQAAQAGDRIILAGRREDVPRVLRSLDGFVLPSYREGMPVSLLEAMATGLPCIATRIRGCREAVEDGVSGMLVPPRDVPTLAEAMAALVSDQGRRSRLGQQARQRVVERYAVECSLEGQLALYQRLVAQPQVR